VPITEILRYAQNDEYGRWRTQHAASLQIMGRGKRIFLQGFAENGAEFWKNFADDDIFAKTKKGRNDSVPTR
jgi:hypothetical protein